MEPTPITPPISSEAIRQEVQEELRHHGITNRDNEINAYNDIASFLIHHLLPA